MKKRLARVGLATLLLLTLQQLAAEPLTGDTLAHDPSLWIAASGEHYVFATGEGLQRLRSADGLNWSRMAPIFSAANRPAWWDSAVPAHQGLDVWAPKLFQHRDKFWLAYSISTFGKNVSAIGLASAGTADASDWRDEGILLASAVTDKFNAIDPDVLIDTDGRVWLSYGSFWGGIRITALDPLSLRPQGETRFIANHPGGIEAPTLIRRGDWYYLFVSHDKCCRGVASSYNIRVGRSKQAMGPFVDREGRPMLDGGGSLIEAGGPRWKGPGHQDVFGNKLARHAYDAEDGGRPHLRIDELRWSADGWPSL
ncbi:arabinan endo-1,5-alpha-L-arabinosidase [Roseateles oligotrophus]|uniref:Arabinan endo-1,5-alpha-L-arabinosidase n=1 Tax=Roseateles oligotrophus TaxID=1769250 RepID=A0ABT2YHU3_9BURK|nr:arabinan endo-1,5-alpha-L-arabinosidase [Roseateles oligotrophus]MCV2369619.1 arabinan endo-1,5-alpha-L-arabinosidase [Roseateles oligotrophus]